MAISVTPAYALILKGYASHQPQPQAPGVVGINLEILPDVNPLIVEVYSGTPAAKAGLLPGDEVLAVNAVSLIGFSSNQVDNAISDVPGDVVNLWIGRDGRMFSVNITVGRLDQIPAAESRSFYPRLFSD